MPRSKRPSFLSKQKEQKRRAKANEKREERRARQKDKAARDRADVAPTEAQAEDSPE
ncbi:MAG TPA: hypothetical protein VFA36_05970 [Burkholderiales bacterium]|nr:hypothetical protein [Burkholderiales bacterium]